LRKPDNGNLQPIIGGCKMKTGFGSVAAVALAVLLSASLTAQIQDKVQLHGFGGWAGGFTDNDNSYASIAGKETPLANYYLALNVSARLERNVSIFAQPCWQSNLNGKEVTLDYAFGQWMIAPQFGLRAGKIKNPIGIYSEILNVGTLRPFYLVPQGRYLDYGALPAYTGIGFVGTFGADPLEISYHLFKGNYEYQMIYIEAPAGFDPITFMPQFSKLSIYSEGRNLTGGEVTIRTPVSGFMISGAYTTSDLYYGIGDGVKVRTGDKRTANWSGEAEYSGERFLFRAEYWKMNDQNVKIKSAYAEAAYKITSSWQLALQYDWARYTMPAVKDVLNEHDAAGAGINYWVNSDFVFKLNYYRVEGNIIARPVNPSERALLGTLQEKTKVLIFGTQFSF
jgi:hypothetical protein